MTTPPPPSSRAQTALESCIALLSFNPDNDLVVAARAELSGLRERIGTLLQRDAMLVKDRCEAELNLKTVADRAERLRAALERARQYVVLYGMCAETERDLAIIDAALAEPAGGA